MCDGCGACPATHQATHHGRTAKFCSDCVNIHAIVNTLLAPPTRDPNYCIFNPIVKDITQIPQPQ